MTTKRVIGHLPVDAGVVMVGDPCYTLPDSGSGRTAVERNWPTFCDFLMENQIDQKGFVALRNDAAFVLKTAYGDGLYPVTGEFDQHGRLLRFTVDFDPEAPHDPS